MKNRSIKRLVQAKDVQMGSMILKQPLPLQDLEQVDPFLLLHHAGPKTQQAGGRKAMDVGPHPHRGFEPVTFIFKGAIHHKDSRGNDSIIHAGGVQWMTAGMGIVHSEGLPQEFIEAGGEIEIIQLWINLPAKDKMIQPRYQGFQADEIPLFKDQEGKVEVSVVSGSYKNLEGPVESLTGVTAFTVRLKTGGKVDIPQSKDQQILLYQLQGNSFVNGVRAKDHNMVLFEEDGDNIQIEAQEESTFLYLAGTPIKEKMVSWGPYVMNDQTQIMEAMRDYQMGKMGVLV